MQYTREQLIDKARDLLDIYETWQTLNETVNALDTYFRDDASVQSYALASLKIATSSSHGYVTRDANIGQAIAQLANDIEVLLDEGDRGFVDAGIDITDLRSTIGRCQELAED